MGGYFPVIATTFLYDLLAKCLKLGAFFALLSIFLQYRPPLAPLERSQTNWTEAYDVSADIFQVNNLADGGPGGLPPSILAEWSAMLWDVAVCSGASCP